MGSKAMAMAAEKIDEKGKFDELVEDKGVKILIDPKALMHVIGTKMDFVDDKLRSVVQWENFMHILAIDYLDMAKIL
ncbi:hypothetical protein TSUD_22290 [Trifolium subterraneum]|uniref:Uncharacterized protein n=1 Tax=Trifolium subterraneum TaxID=3900 RepID=A0A2Z6MQ00_TRISU|nr:hypothetical protein TSUD_22290 [Trifolium subterraneum]